jgi:hypothetical protein
MASRSRSHQLLLLTIALVLVAGLFLLPKVMVKPKEGKGELTQHGHFISHDFGDVTRLIVFVLILPRPDATFDIYLVAFAQILLGYLRQTPPGGDVVPFSALDAGASFVLVILVCGQRKIGHAYAAFQVAYLRVFTQISN